MIRLTTTFMVSGKIAPLLVKQSMAWLCTTLSHAFNTLGPRQNGRQLADDIFKCIFLNKIVWIPLQISQKFIHQGPINNNPALV